MHIEVYLHTHTRKRPCTCAHVDFEAIPSISSAFFLLIGPIFSPIKPVIALGNKKSINPVSVNKTTLVWQEAAFLVADNMLWVFARVGITYYKKNTTKVNSSVSFFLNWYGCYSFSCCLHSLKAALPSTTTALVSSKNVHRLNFINTVFSFISSSFCLPLSLFLFFSSSAPVSVFSPGVGRHQ